MASKKREEMKMPPASRVRERQAGYGSGAGDEGENEFHFTKEELKVSPFDAADYIREDEEAQLYLLRNALADGHPGYIAEAIAAVARARGLGTLERETGIKRQTLDELLSIKGNPTLETLTTVLKALGLRLEVV